MKFTFHVLNCVIGTTITTRGRFLADRIVTRE
ncbi:UNVERIFIED_CONTAM: hypothetical protein NCL1_61073 [Trichonephila clavipes]